MAEAYPQDTQGKRTSGSFLYNGTRSLFEQAGFSYELVQGKEPLCNAQDGFTRPSAVMSKTGRASASG